MQANFDKALKAFWAFDGAKQDAAPGETFATSYGVTEMTWNNAVDNGIVSGDMDGAPVSDYATVLRAMFWNVMACDALPSGVDLFVFNDACLAGTGHTARLLQRCVGLTGDDVDGQIGPQTLHAVATIRPADLIARLRSADISFLSALHTWPLYHNGWTRREAYMASAALMLMGPDAAPVKTA